MRWLIWIIMVVIIADVSGRLFVLQDDTRFNLVKSDTSSSRRLLVYLPGILADGVQSSLTIVDTWKQYGDVLLVSYDGTRFKRVDAIADVTRWINNNTENYDEIVFIGSSMGGLLSYDIEPNLQPTDDDIKFVIIASPPGRSYFKSPNDKTSAGMWAWWAGPISNWTTGKAFLKVLFQKPKDENVEPEVNRNELDKRVKEAQASPFSVYSDQIRYMIGHEPMIEGALQDRQGVYIRCSRDDIVASNAYEPWNMVFGGELALVESDTTHAGYNEMPEAFKADFEKAFALIGVTKD